MVRWFHSSQSPESRIADCRQRKAAGTAALHKAKTNSGRDGRAPQGENHQRPGRPRSTRRKPSAAGTAALRKAFKICNLRSPTTRITTAPDSAPSPETPGLYIRDLVGYFLAFLHPKCRSGGVIPLSMPFAQVLLIVTQVTLAQGPEAAKSLPVGPKPLVGPVAPSTDAEKIANANDSIRRATSAVEKIQQRVDDPKGEYHQAETEFEALNLRLKETKANVAKLRKEGKEAEAVALDPALAVTQAEWQLAKERFDIAIRQKKANVEAIAGLKERIVSDQHLLDRLNGKKEPPSAPTPTPRPVQVAAPKPDPKVPPVAEPKVVTETPVAPKEETQPASLADAALAPDENDPDLKAARQELDSRRGELDEANAHVREAEERVRVTERSIRTADKMMELERESVTQAEKAAMRLATTLRADPPSDAEEHVAMTERLVNTEQRLAESRDRLQRVTDRRGTLVESLADHKAELALVKKEAEGKQKDVMRAEVRLKEILSPTAPRNLYRWVAAKGPRILLIIGCMFVVHLMVRQFSRRIVNFISRHSERGSPDDRENRAHTLVGVFRYAAGLAVFGGGLVMLLDEIGVPIVPLMGGAAVIGLAVAFGAQNLIRDYFTGFMMLMEDQYSVNDVVKIGGTSGLVEMITLRVTVLRDLEGVRHFIPHGTITNVSNLTHGWSRAKMDISIAYKENIDRVVDVLMELGRKLRLDPVFGKHILDNPEMLGVESLAESGVVIRFLLKTRPLHQWAVRREMLRRIKNRFDELGIELPYPHRSVYHHFPDGASGTDSVKLERERYAA